MKKKFLGLTAVVMSMAMASTSFAAVARGDGKVSGRDTFNGQDLAIIADYAANGDGNKADAANFDGSWAATDNKVTASDLTAAIQYMLQPENFDEQVAIRVYSSSNTAVGTSVFNVQKHDELDSAKGYDGTYADTTVGLTAGTNATIKQVADELVQQVNQKAADTAAEQITKVYFTSAEKGDVYLTTDEGWSVLAYSLRAIVPVSEADCIICNKDYDSLPAEEKATAGNKDAQVAALNAIKSKIVTNGAELKLTAADIQEIYAQAQIAFPADTPAEEINTTADRVAEIVKDKYTVTINGKRVFDSQSEGTQSLVKLANYEKTTINDVLAEFGDQIEVVVTGPSGTATFNADLYVTGGAK
jgi:hypothetical protein